MKRVKKQAKRREKYLIYKGQSIHVNSVYQPENSKFRVGLFYCPVLGRELFFKSIGRAKRYLDSVQNIIPAKTDEIPF